MNKIITKKCIVCEKDYEFQTVPHRTTKVIRKKNGLTCSKKCAKVYSRVYRYFYGKHYGYKKELSKAIFDDISAAIKNTVSSTPIPIENSEFMEKLQELKKRYCRDEK